MKSTKKIVILVLTIIMLWGSAFSVQANSFKFNVTTEKEEVKAGDIVKIDMQVSGIDVEEGINVIEANLECDETVFDGVAFENTNGWTTNYQIEKGKVRFLTTKIEEGITQEEKIGQIQLKIKDNLEKMETEIKINEIASNDGMELIKEEDKSIKIKIDKKLNEDQNGSLNGDSNGSQNGGQSVIQTGNQNGGQSGSQNGSSIVSQNNANNVNNAKNVEDTEGPKVMDSIMGDNIKTGDKIVLVVLIAIILIGVNLAYFIIKRKQSKKPILIIIVISILLMVMIVFLAKDVFAYTGQEIAEMIQLLKNENKNNPESTEYLVTDKIIARVKPETTAQMLESKLENVKVGTGNGTEIVKTGMTASYEENGRTYEISVLGDINGDGVLNQIDLTREIREYLKSEKWKIEKELERLSADVTYDGNIDETDINSMINYIIEGQLEERKVETVLPPKVEVIEGTNLEGEIYISSVRIRVAPENDETKTAKTVYEIAGTKKLEEKELASKEEEIELIEPGVYKVTGYTYGMEGNKSKASDVIIVIETPDIILNTEEWTNQNVTVTIEEKEGCEMEYKIDDGEWKKYDKKFEVEENCTITVRPKTEEGYGTEIKKEITNIDKEIPTGKIEATGSGVSKIALELEGQDAQLSGIKEIRVFAKEQSATEYECKATYPYEEDTNKNALKKESLVLRELKPGTTYDIYMEVEDRAGNILKENTTISKTTEEMATPVLVATPIDWTNDKVEVTIEGEEGYTTEYKINNGDWLPYTQKIELIQNCTITARLIENEYTNNTKEATKEITNIDKASPNTFTPVVNSTSNSIVMSGNTTDQDKTATNGSSGIDKYYFSKDNGNTWEPSEGKIEPTYIFTNLPKETTYQLKMKAVDKAGNEVITDTLTKATVKVPDLTSSNTTFTYSTTAPTNQDVIVTILTTAGSGYTLQYSKDNTNWYDYQAALSMSQNGNIYARLKDSSGQVGSVVTGNVTNIDKIIPNNATIALNATSATVNANVTATVTHSDSQSGVKVASCKWIYTTNGSAIGTNPSSYTGGTFSSNPQTLTLRASSTGTYYLHVLTIDNAGNAKESISGGVLVENPPKADGSWTGTVNSPKLKSDMVPVYWDTSNSEKTLTSTSSIAEWKSWYNYVSGDNATDTKTSKWANIKMTKNGATSYFVWIPRYEYKILSGEGTSTAGKIEVKFIPTSQTTPDAGYRIHPAFRNGTSNNFKNGEWDSELPGIWVGKYETSHSDATASAAGSSDTLKIVPGVQSWNNIHGGRSYEKALSYDTSKGSHLMKNSEWGAVVYLTHSQYGRNGHEIDVNNSSTRITGNGGGGTDVATIEGITNAYNTLLGAQASSTGNIYGIYDLYGGSTEYIAAYVPNSTAVRYKNLYPFVNATTANENGYQTLSTKYATAYPYNAAYDSPDTAAGDNTNSYLTIKNQNYGYGDAILETSSNGSDHNSWFRGDAWNYLSHNLPFMSRGGRNNGLFGVGSCLETTAQGMSSYSFRVVLAGN